MRTATAALLAVGCGSIPQYQTPDPGACAEPDPVVNDYLPVSHSWPDSPAWPLPDDVGEQGYEVGDTINNYRLTDTRGDPVCQWQFAGRTAVIDISAYDCGPCQVSAREVVCTARDFGDDFVYVTILQDRLSGQEVGSGDIEEWAEFFDIHEPNTPVVMDPGSVWTAPVTTNPPSFLVVGPDLTVTGVKHGWGTTGDEDLRELIAETMGVDPHPNGPDSCAE